MMVDLQLAFLEFLDEIIRRVEQYIRAINATNDDIQRLKTLPGISDILAPTIYFETGTIDRFPGPGHYRSYCGLAPKIHASGGRVWLKRLPRAANLTLKWAFIEAANVIACHAGRRHYEPTYQRYLRARERLGPGKAKIHVAQHLTTLVYVILKRKTTYQPYHRGVSSRHG